MILHLTAHFSGHVQGVGFRYQTQRIATEFEVSGFVQNLPDGRVLLEAEGESEEVEGFLAEIRSQMKVFIRETEERRELRNSVMKGFVIKR